LKRLVLGRGNIFSRIIIIGEAPGANEDIKGKPFVGKSGTFLNRLLTLSGINLKDIYFCNVIKCRPPNNRKPSKEEVDAHKPWLLQQIKLIDPEIIILSGSTAMKAILDINQPISDIRGKWIKKNKRDYITIFHPSYLMRFSTKDSTNPYGLTLNDLINVRKKLYDL
tara:strand:+ start:534 stop:1034 length:501 start_codon:yes stop_codon:yes gene_type:complete